MDSRDFQHQKTVPPWFFLVAQKSFTSWTTLCALHLNEKHTKALQIWHSRTT